MKISRQNGPGRSTAILRYIALLRLTAILLLCIVALVHPLGPADSCRLLGRLGYCLSFRSGAASAGRADVCRAGY